MNTALQQWSASPPQWMTDEQQAIAAQIVFDACRPLNVPPSSLFRPKRGTPAAAHARAICMVRVRKRFGMTLAETGRFFGGRTHGAVIHAERRVTT